MLFNRPMRKASYLIQVNEEFVQITMPTVLIGDQMYSSLAVIIDGLINGGWLEPGGRMAVKQNRLRNHITMNLTVWCPMFTRAEKQQHAGEAERES